MFSLRTNRVTYMHGPRYRIHFRFFFNCLGLGAARLQILSCSLGACPSIFDIYRTKSSFTDHLAAFSSLILGRWFLRLHKFIILVVLDSFSYLIERPFFKLEPFSQRILFRLPGQPWWRSQAICFRTFWGCFWNAIRNLRPTAWQTLRCPTSFQEIIFADEISCLDTQPLIFWLLVSLN